MKKRNTDDKNESKKVTIDKVPDEATASTGCQC